MKAVKLKHILFLLFIVICSISIFLLNFNHHRIDMEVDGIYYNNYFPDNVFPETYEEKCYFEDKYKITFPRTKPYKVVLVSNYSYIKRKYVLNENEINKLLSTLNDSTNYRWGELGTPEFHYYFKYLNEKGELIGITEVDTLGMAYSDPYLAKMKWGGMANIKLLNELIKSVKNNT